MPQVVAFADAKANQLPRPNALRTPFLTSSAATPDQPVAFLLQDGRITKPHYHSVDQFQIIVEGRGKFGGHKAVPYYVHFSRAHTPYGPLTPEQNTWWGYLTLRARFDPGAHFFPEAKEELKQIPGRQPWQITRHVQFPSQEGRAIPDGIKLQDIPGIRDDQGLFACSLTMAPNTKALAPDPSHGDGQYLVAVGGSLWYDDKEHQAYTVAFITPEEAPFQLHAGGQGLEALVLNFPRPRARIAVAPARGSAAGFKKWQCELCSFAYDEALGLPDEGIPAGTRWEDVPETWSCPDCSASKGDFKMVEVQSVG